VRATGCLVRCVYGPDLCDRDVVCQRAEDEAKLDAGLIFPPEPNYCIEEAS
jgi:hypothetical protein